LPTLTRFPIDFRRRVLVVDDDTQVRGAIARQVHSLGYVADSAGDAAKAILMASVYDYEVIVTDLLMPQVGGMALMTVLAESSAIASFILMTGASDLGNHVSPAVGGRLTTVLAKPFGKHDLQNALDQAFEVTDKRRALAAAPQAGTGRVLLLEDSSSDALLVRQALDALGGFETTHVERLTDAIRLLHDEHFETVIADLTLPDARGLGAVLRIKECAPNALLLVCSSVADEALALRVIELGAQDFIVKGTLNSETLGRAIRFANVRRKGERRLARLAHSDPLTGLWNRAAFAERLDHALAQAKRQATSLGVMYIDLDGFKTINDLHGHDVGDALLKQAASRISQCLREYDAVARLGGDEFAVLATNLAEGSALATAERIARALAAPFEIDAARVTVSASIGIASFPESAQEAVLLVKLADEAMYSAKRSGKNRVCLAPRSALTARDSAS
jgi:diguanylate cyclase (GGDEF)-like protein